MERLLTIVRDGWDTVVEFLRKDTIDWEITMGQWIGVIAVGSLVCYIIYLRSPRHEERLVSKRKIQAEHRRVKEVVGDNVSVAIETAVGEKKITREQAEFWYKKLGTIGLNDLGYEPTYGKVHDRMWRKPMLPNWVVKSAIWSRLSRSGTSVRIRLDRMRGKKPPSKKAELLASIARRTA